MRAAVVVALLAVSLPAYANDTNLSVHGLWLTTSYPALQIRAGEETTLPLTIYNYGLPPQRTSVDIVDKPPDWTAQIDFNFSVTAKNESASDMLVKLGADAPNGFTTVFKEGYGTQELTSIPIKAGESKDISVAIKPAPETPAGSYPVLVTMTGDKAKAATKLSLDVAGQPSLTLTGQDDRLSGSAYAGQEKSFPMVIRNQGTAEARNITLSASPPSGWKVSLDPKQVADVPVDGEVKVSALVTPSAKALAGDYVVAMTASGNGQSESASYRLSVLTSTLWGVTGVGVIGAALLVLVGAVGRFGRR